MIWGCLKSCGKVMIRKLDHTVNSDSYKKVLFEDVFTQLSNIISGFVFQQDNARPHIFEMKLQHKTRFSHVSQFILINS
ncbi:hypothetical protein A3Q56_01042 [Intoshia linei]|uniref:Uncharacterized protein n=1 Tax=Intoshia linei TaxID=1819745 RepID=A0A177BCD1_9BILA|nr:hypothetical protein A3Q56_01042 [Intoshia linei]